MSKRKNFYIDPLPPKSEHVAVLMRAAGSCECRGQCGRHELRCHELFGQKDLFTRSVVQAVCVRTTISCSSVRRETLRAVCQSCAEHWNPRRGEERRRSESAPLEDRDFGLLRGKAKRDEGMARAEAAADEAWKAAAMAAVLSVARSQECFTTDEVWSRLDGSGLGTHEPRAMGPIIMAARRAGWCEPSAAGPVTSSRESCHARPKRVWLSLVHEGG